MSKKEAVSAVPMRVLKVDTCPSLSGRSQLTYHVGCDNEGTISLKITANSGSGQFNADWVPLSIVEQLMSAHPATKPMTSGVLRTVFKHRSSNSPAFLFAALKAESLVLPGDTKDSGYTLGNIEAFKQTMSALVASDTDLSTPVDIPVPTSAKPKRNAKGAA